MCYPSPGIGRKSRLSRLPLDDNVVIRIQQSLETVESREDVVVLLAVESGSRAWGFASVDSDYDVRFVYVYRPEWYLSIDLEGRRDVIERPIQNEIDLNGWDLRKALKLFSKSKPPLLEWLQCSILYRERFLLAKRLRAYCPSSIRPGLAFIITFTWLGAT